MALIDQELELAAPTQHPSPCADLRLRQLSYSSLELLNTCPRAFELYKITPRAEVEVDSSSNLTFAYGHMVGQAVQDLFSGKSMQQVVWQAFLGWHADLLAENTKQNKSFWLAMQAVSSLAHLYSSGVFDNYELLWLPAKDDPTTLVPACELSFFLQLPDDYVYVGSLDAVLRNKLTGEYLVLEIKTSSMNSISAELYSNSSQALGYSVVLDAIAPEASSYQVLYLVYKTKSTEWEILPFIKTASQQADWLASLELERQRLSLYVESGLFPKYGSGCRTRFGSLCPHYGQCDMERQLLATPYQPETQLKNPADYHYVVQFADLVNRAASKASQANDELSHTPLADYL